MVLSLRSGRIFTRRMDQWLSSVSSVDVLAVVHVDSTMEVFESQVSGNLATLRDARLSFLETRQSHVVLRNINTKLSVPSI